MAESEPVEATETSEVAQPEVKTSSEPAEQAEAPAPAAETVLETNGETEAEATKPKAKKPAKRKSPAASTPVRASKRQRKQVKHFVPDTKMVTKKKTEIEEGAGTALSEHPNVVRNLLAIKSDDDLVKKLHRLLFGTPGRKSDAKRNIRAFNGFANTPDTFEETKKAQLGKLSSHDLTDLAKLLDARKAAKGLKEELVDNLYDFFLDPQPSSGEGLQPGRRSGSKKSKSKKGKKGTSERKPTGYMLFGKAERPKINEEMSLAPKEIMSEIGKRWRGLSEKQKDKWNKKAQSAGPLKSKSKKKPAKKKAKPSVEETSDESSSEEEEEEEGDPLEKKLRAEIKKILKKAFQEDQDTVKSKEVRKVLKKKFGDVIDERKDWVKGLIKSVYEKLG